MLPGAPGWSEKTNNPEWANQIHRESAHKINITFNWFKEKKQLAPGVIAEIAEPEIRKELPSSSCKTAYLEKWNRSSYS
jgi:hypothetical protein